MSELAIKPRLAVVLGTGDTEIRYSLYYRDVYLLERLVLNGFIT